MIKDKEALKKFENSYLRNEKLTIKEKYAILDAMAEEAIYLKILPLKEPLEGLEHLIEFVKDINSV